MTDQLALSLLLAVSLSVNVYLYFKYKLVENAGQNREEDCSALLSQLLEAQKEVQQSRTELEFNKSVLTSLSQREIKCVLNDGQAAQLIQTVGQIVTQTKQGVVN